MPTDRNKPGLYYPYNLLSEADTLNKKVAALQRQAIKARLHENQSKILLFPGEDSSWVWDNAWQDIIFLPIEIDLCLQLSINWKKKVNYTMSHFSNTWALDSADLTMTSAAFMLRLKIRSGGDLISVPVVVRNRRRRRDEWGNNYR